MVISVALSTAPKQNAKVEHALPTTAKAAITSMPIYVKKILQPTAVGITTLVLLNMASPTARTVDVFWHPALPIIISIIKLVCWMIRRTAADKELHAARKRIAQRVNASVSPGIRHAVTDVLICNQILPTAAAANTHVKVTKCVPQGNVSTNPSATVSRLTPPMTLPTAGSAVPSAVSERYVPMGNVYQVQKKHIVTGNSFKVFPATPQTADSAGTSAT
jgi:hypothetical protein